MVQRECCSLGQKKGRLTPAREGFGRGCLKGKCHMGSLAPQPEGKLHRVTMFERIEIFAAVICDTKREVGYGVEQEAG